MSLEKQLRGVYDRARGLLAEIESARDALAAENTKLVAWKLGCATGSTVKLQEELIKIAQQEFYEARSDEDE